MFRWKPWRLYSVYDQGPVEMKKFWTKRGAEKSRDFYVLVAQSWLKPAEIPDDVKYFIKHV